MKVTREMIGAAHDICLKKGDFVLSADLLERIYLAMDALANHSETSGSPSDRDALDAKQNLFEVARGVTTRYQARGFYMPEDTKDLIEVIEAMKGEKE